MDEDSTSNNNTNKSFEVDYNARYIEGILRRYSVFATLAIKVENVHRARFPSHMAQNADVALPASSGACGSRADTFLPMQQQQPKTKCRESTLGFQTRKVRLGESENSK